MSTTHSQSQGSRRLEIHPLEIAEILTLISQHLHQKRDLAHACRVNKAFFEPFASQLWVTVGQDQLKKPSFQRSLRKYSTRIRHLTYPREIKKPPQLPQRKEKKGKKGNKSEHPPKPKPDNNLTLPPGLELIGIKSFTPPAVHKNNLEDVLRILETNKNSLENLTLRCPNLILSSKLIQTLSELSNLKSLDIEAVIIPEGAIEFMISRMPLLTKLRMEEFKNPRRIHETPVPATASDLIWGFGERPPMGYDHATAMEFYTSFSSSSSSTSAISTTAAVSYYGLTELKIKTGGCSFHPLLALVEKCPRLVTLEIADNDDGAGVEGRERPLSPRYETLAQALHSSCPRLKDLLLNTTWIGKQDLFYVLGLWEPEEALPIEIPIASTGCHWLALRTLHVETVGHGVEYYHVLDAVEQAEDVLRDTLEDLTVTGNDPTDWERSATIAKILTTFKRLRVLSVDCAVVILKDLTVGGVDPCEGPSDDEYWTKYDGPRGRKKNKATWMLKPWACKDIQKLVVSIDGNHDDWCPQYDVRHPKKGRNKNRRRSGPPAMYSDEEEEYSENEKKTYPVYDRILSILRQYRQLKLGDLMFWPC